MAFFLRRWVCGWDSFPHRWDRGRCSVCDETEPNSDFCPKCRVPYTKTTTEIEVEVPVYETVEKAHPDAIYKHFEEYEDIQVGTETRTETKVTKTCPDCGGK
jgi:hypothetical protein